MNHWYGPYSTSPPLWPKGHLVDADPVASALLGAAEGDLACGAEAARFSRRLHMATATSTCICVHVAIYRCECTCTGMYYVYMYTYTHASKYA